MRNWALPLVFWLLANTVYSQEKFSDNFKMGQTAFGNSDFESAVKYFQNAISDFSANNDSIHLGECYLGIGMTYGKLKNYQASQGYVAKAKGIFERLNNDSMVIRANNILGNLLAVNQKFDEALSTYNYSLKLATDKGLIDRQGSIMNNIGELHYNRKNFELAIKHFESALLIARQLKSNYGMSVSLMNIGKCYNDLGRAKKATTYIMSGIEIARNIHDIYQLQFGYEQLAKCYFNDSNFKDAFSCLTLYLQYKDSISSIEINKQVAAQEAKFQSQQKLLEIVNLKAEKQKNEILALESQSKIKSLQYFNGVIVLFLIVVLLVSILFFRQYKNKVALTVSLEQSREDLQQRNTELNESLSRNDKLQRALKQDLENYKQLAYRKQMNPHFIFNSLNAIQNYILTNNKLEANYYLGELSTLIRRILENSEKDFVSLKEELFVSETYIKLEQKRFEERFSYKINCHNEIDMTKVKIPPLLLQPFIENAIWHGLLHKQDNAILEIVVSREAEGIILICIKDNGVGRNNAPTTSLPNAVKTESLGINLTMNRINLSNCIMDERIELRIIDLLDKNQHSLGTEVVITLHQHEEYESAT